MSNDSDNIIKTNNVGLLVFDNMDSEINNTD